MRDPLEIRREVRRLIALWLLMYPEDADLPSDVMRQMAALHVFAREHRGEGTLWPLSLLVEPSMQLQ
jgi:hypothetical protein